ncbi:MAG TPA: haloacid dehalogenase type II [Vicinamibacterales bacterium]
MNAGLRTFASLVGAAVLFVAQAPPSAAEAAPKPRFKAVAFDFLALFDANSVLPAVEDAFPGNALELTQLWRTRQFEYTWLRSITSTYVDFRAVTDDALVYAAKALKLELTPGQRARLLNAFLQLAPWPDTRRALGRLRASGVRVIALANFTPAMLEANARHAGLTECFDALVSTDGNHTYKPDPRAYALGVERLRLPKKDVLFAAFAGWDAAGAKAFGYPTAWVNRSNQTPEELDVRPDQICRDVDALADYVLGVAPDCRP